MSEFWYYYFSLVLQADFHSRFPPIKLIRNKMFLVKFIGNLIPYISLSLDKNIKMYDFSKIIIDK